MSAPADDSADIGGMHGIAIPCRIWAASTGNTRPKQTPLREQ